MRSFIPSLHIIFISLSYVCVKYVKILHHTGKYRGGLLPAFPSVYPANHCCSSQTRFEKSLLWGKSGLFSLLLTPAKFLCTHPFYYMTGSLPREVWSSQIYLFPLIHSFIDVISWLFLNSYYVLSSGDTKVSKYEANSALKTCIPGTSACLFLPKHFLVFIYIFEHIYIYIITSVWN
jgi:hypothetical protein